MPNECGHVDAMVDIEFRFMNSSCTSVVIFCTIGMYILLLLVWFREESCYIWDENWYTGKMSYFYELVQGRRNTIAITLELCLSCSNQWICNEIVFPQLSASSLTHWVCAQLIALSFVLSNFAFIGGILWFRWFLLNYYICIKSMTWLLQSLWDNPEGYG